MAAAVPPRGLAVVLLLAAAASGWAQAAACTVEAEATAWNHAEHVLGVAGAAPAADRELFRYDLPGPVYPTHLFPKLAALLEHWTVLRDDAVQITHDMNLVRTATSFDGDAAEEFVRKVVEGGNSGWTTAWTRDRGWKNYGLVVRNEAFPGVTETLCPRSVALLKSIPGMRLGGFSKLLPNARIETHVDNAGLSHNSLAVHVYLAGHARMPSRATRSSLTATSTTRSSTATPSASSSTSSWTCRSSSSGPRAST